MSLSKVPTLIKQNRQARVNKRPSQELPADFSGLYTHPPEKKDTFECYWFGHSAVKLHMNGLNILIDPQLGPVASPVPGTVSRFSDVSNIEWDKIPEIDLLVYSHDHYDHLDYYSFKKLQAKVIHFLVPLGVGSHLIYWGVPENKITECDWNEEYEYGGIQFAARPNKHFSGRAPKTRNNSLWCGWAIRSPFHNIYFSSDSGYFDGFRETGEKYGPFDLCFVECGQYNTLWKENHMMPEESLQAFIDLEGKLMLPIHWAGFSLAPHDWKEPIERLFNAAETRGYSEKIITPKLGKIVTLAEKMPKEQWWKTQA